MIYFETTSIWLIIWSAVSIPIFYASYLFVTFLIDVITRGKAVDKFPMDPKHWLMGHVHLYPDEGEARLKFQIRQTLKYPRAYGIWHGNWIRPAVIVHHPELIQAVFKSTDKKPMGLGVYGYAVPWIGEGLLLNPGGAKWTRNRKLLSPAFNLEILKSYVDVKNKAVDIFLEKLLKSSNDGQSFEFFGNVSLLTLDIILRCACSYENDVQMKGEAHPYLQAVVDLGNLIVSRAMRPWLHFDIVYKLTKDYRRFSELCKYVHSISENVIASRKKQLVDNGKNIVGSRRSLDFLDILLSARDEDGNGLTDGEIRDEVDTFLFAGHDTTASSIAWVLYSLAENPDHQKLCQTEIDEILADRADDNIRWDDLAKLNHLSMCIKESLRMHSPVPFISRETREEMVLEGVLLPKGSLIDIEIYNLHHNPIVWDQPVEFRPSRFLPENTESRDVYAFLPFSAGSRNCIGQHFAMNEQKLVIARILKRFSIELDPNFEVKKKIGIVMKTENGMFMKAILRN